MPIQDPPKATKWATMTVATNALMTAMISASSLTELPFDDYSAHLSDHQVLDEQSLRSHAPATWLDAVSVDERCRAEKALPLRGPAPCDEAGLYPRFLRLND